MKSNAANDGHARGHRHLPPPPAAAEPKSVTPRAGRHQPWVPKNALAGRSRRSSHQ